MPGALHLRHLCKRIQFGILQHIGRFNPVNRYEKHQKNRQSGCNCRRYSRALMVSDTDNDMVFEFLLMHFAPVQIEQRFRP